jgi:hypothetical protein
LPPAALPNVPTAVVDEDWKDPSVGFERDGYWYAPIKQPAFPFGLDLSSHLWDGATDHLDCDDDGCRL